MGAAGVYFPRGLRAAGAERQRACGLAAMATLFAALRENHPPTTVHLSGCLIPSARRAQIPPAAAGRSRRCSAWCPRLAESLCRRSG